MREFNLAAYVLNAGEAVPEKIALAILGLTGAERWSYGRLIGAVRGCGTWLSQRAAPGDRILIRMANTPAYPVLYLGAIAAGMVPVATSPLLTTPEITRMAALIRPRLILTDPGIALPETLPHSTALPADLAAWEASRPCPYHLGDAEREAYIVFTSGTSGRPMAVRHAHRAILARQKMHQGWEGLTPQDRMMHAGAFNWTYTMGTGLLDPWTLGATALIPGAQVPQEHLGLLIKRHDATIFAGSPAHFRRLLRNPLPPMPRLRHALSAGEALPPAVRQAWRDTTGTEIHEAYGMSEISTFISASPDRPAPPNATGFPQQGRRIAVLSPEGQALPPGEMGQLAISTKDQGLMLSYLDQPPPEGDWFVTGDLVHQGWDGAIHYAGRADEMMNPGGIRVSPREVELALSDLPGVTELAVTEIAAADGASFIACFYAGDTLPEYEAAAFAAERLARYKQPRAWVQLDALPRTASAKINRRALAALYPKDPQR
ncbi:class I adenylate-forming enzyme family protein [Xinfangfangia sp. CPCC 101601]|uniref:Class I adenylate-forming enzyme family protein n=1 Tax=Pseudogemmobacter lacusdianii TaxID=3069608 RepID=A0ABU0VUL9_9RHOB|nr:class I adenylate-forming enzyme family protein [Xinfangfangia sp. CPCC 101601]MDQ2065426.1 class I adenylate-forming enzyme family protein [Xinfangfangia sp. CPCC 101601]